MVAPPMPHSPRILVVDDEADVREAVASLLETFVDNVHVHIAASGLDGLRVLKNEAVDLIVTDFKMPGMNGAQFLGEASKVAPGTPHIMVTAFDREALQSLGSPKTERIVHKPFEPETLLGAVNEALATAG